MSDDICSLLFRYGTKAYCVCTTLRRLKHTTITYLQLHCDASRSVIRHSIGKLERERIVRKVYADDVDYDVEWIGPV